MLDLVDRWLEWLVVSRGRSSSTASKYRNYLVRLDRYLVTEGVALADVDSMVLEQFTGMVLFKDGLSARSRRAAIASVKGFFAWLCKDGALTVDPATGLFYPKAGRRLPRPMMLDQAGLLFKQPDLDTFLGIRDLTILFVMAGCGLRVSDLTRLNVSNLAFYLDDKDQERLMIRVLGKGSRERLVPAPDEARLMLRAYLNHPELVLIDRTLEDGDQVLFVSLRNRMVPECDYVGEARRLLPGSINEMMVKYGEQAGIDRRACHPHALRHLYGKELSEEDTNLLVQQGLLGHADPKTTEIYSHIATRKMVAAVDKANPLRKIPNPISDLARAMK